MRVSPLWFSHDGPKSLKKRPKTLKNPLTPIGSCRELHNINSRLKGAVDRELGGGGM